MLYIHLFLGAPVWIINLQPFDIEHYNSNEWNIGCALNLNVPLAVNYIWNPLCSFN